MLKRYYSISEAAEFLTSEHKEKVNPTDVLILAARDEIQLCVWFDGCIATFSALDPFEPPKATPLGYSPSSFGGYIRIPKEVIKPSGGIVYFDDINIVEIVQSYEDFNLPEIDHCFFWGAYTCIPETGEVKHIEQEANLEDAVIPALDLLNLSLEERSQKEVKKLSTTERNTLLTIIGIMAKDGYNHDLSKPFQAAKEIQIGAEKLGIKISDDTIASKLKEAKKILTEKSE